MQYEDLEGGCSCKVGTSKNLCIECEWVRDNDFMEEDDEDDFENYEYWNICSCGEYAGEDTWCEDCLDDVALSNDMDEHEERKRRRFEAQEY
jgi:hypothetical protein